MWILKSMSGGYPPVPDIPLSAFRVGLAIAIAWKVAWEHRWGASRYFDETNYVGWRFHKVHIWWVSVGSNSYRLMYFSRAVATVAILLGVGARFAALALAFWFFFEFNFDRKYHTLFLGLCSMLAACSSGIDNHFTLREGWDLIGGRGGLAPVSPVGVDPLPQILLVLLVAQMYWSSAYHKARSPQFRSGRGLQQIAEHYTTIESEMPFHEIWYAGLVRRFPCLSRPAPIWPGWRLAALSTIFLETIIPVLLLLSSTTWRVSVILGLTMHLGFTLLLPKRLLPFTVATLSTYILFLDPYLFAPGATSAGTLS